MTKSNIEFPSTANGMSRPATEAEIRLAESSGYTHPDLFQTVVQPEDESAHYTIGVFNNESVVMKSTPIPETDPTEIP